MKYILRILIVLIVSAGVICGVYYHQHGSLTPGSGDRKSVV